MTPIIAKIKTTREHTSITLVIDGIDANKALTTSFIPSFYEITLNGLRALKALNALRPYSDEEFTPAA